jgi:hypothetical protein
MSDDNVIRPDFITKGPVPVQAILEQAQSAGLEDVVVIGWVDGVGCYLGTSSGHAPEIIFLLELAKKQVLDECAPT